MVESYENGAQACGPAHLCDVEADVRHFVAIIGVLMLAGCGSSGAAPSTTPALPGETITPRQPARTAVAHPPAGTGQTGTNPSYSAFISKICRNFTVRNASGITSLLPYYQYNSGLRYGQMGDGEGQTGDPSLMSSWLRHSTVRCLLFSQSVAGHGVLMTNGWSQPGGWSLIDLDKYGGAWKINDITFGQRSDIQYAIHVNNPVLPYRG